MANKIIAIVDINNDQNQNIETLLIASILEKKYEKLSVMDLNPYVKTNTFFDRESFKEKAGILTTKVFDRSNYMFASAEALTSLKMRNLTKSLADKNDVLLINTNQVKFDYNTQFYDLANHVVIFVDIKQDPANKLTNFFLTHQLKNKYIHIYVYNTSENIQDNKIYLSLIKQFNNFKNIQLNNIGIINKCSINEIINIDPWDEIYKKINGAF